MSQKMLCDAGTFSIFFIKPFSQRFSRLGDEETSRAGFRFLRVLLPSGILRVSVTLNSLFRALFHRGSFRALFFRGFFRTLFHRGFFRAIFCRGFLGALFRRCFSRALFHKDYLMLTSRGRCYSREKTLEKFFCYLWRKTFAKKLCANPFTIEVSSVSLESITTRFILGCRTSKEKGRPRQRKVIYGTVVDCHIVIFWIKVSKGIVFNFMVNERVFV